MRMSTSTSSLITDDAPLCEGCKYELCNLDRMMDECPMCGHEIPVALRIYEEDYDE